MRQLTVSVSTLRGSQAKTPDQRAPSTVCFVRCVESTFVIADACVSPVVKARSALAGLKIPVAKTSSPASDSAGGVAAKNKRQGVGISDEGAAVDSNAKSQLSQLGARAEKSKASNGPLQAAKQVQFTPPHLPGVGGPHGTRRQPQGAHGMAEQALRNAQPKLRQDARQNVKRPADPAKVKAGFEAASRAMAEAVQKKQSMAGALRSHEL